MCGDIASSLPVTREVVPSVCMSAVLNYAVPGGRRYVCLYDVEEKVLLRRVQISANRSLDGVLDQLNSKHLTDAGHAALLDDAPDDADPLLPPTTAGAPRFPQDCPSAAQLSHGATSCTLHGILSCAVASVLACMLWLSCIECFSCEPLNRYAWLSPEKGTARHSPS